MVSTNQLTGPIPAELSRLSNLEYLSLETNELTGPIPAELGRLRNLQTLELADNQLTGAIPIAWETSPTWGVLLLTSNQLTGAIPAALGDLTNIRTLELDSNELSGAIPAALGNLANLEILLLADNQLTGAIPAALGNLTNLTGLSIFLNAPGTLSGAQPAADLTVRTDGARPGRLRLRPGVFHRFGDHARSDPGQGDPLQGAAVTDRCPASGGAAGGLRLDGWRPDGGKHDQARASAGAAGGAGSGPCDGGTAGAAVDRCDAVLAQGGTPDGAARGGGGAGELSYPAASPYGSTAAATASVRLADAMTGRSMSFPSTSSHAAPVALVGVDDAAPPRPPLPPPAENAAWMTGTCVGWMAALPVKPSPRVRRLSAGEPRRGPARP